MIKDIALFPQLVHSWLQVNNAEQAVFFLDGFLSCWNIKLHKRLSRLVMTSAFLLKIVFIKLKSLSKASVPAN